MASVLATPVSAAMAGARGVQLSATQQQRAAVIRPQQQRRSQRRSSARVAAAVETNGAASPASPVVGATSQQHVVKMVNLVHTYFDVLLTAGDMSVLDDILDRSISHKDMVRNVGRVGMKEYAKYLTDLHKSYPDYFVKPVEFGFVDNRRMFVSFEGQVCAKTPKFYGVDMFHFDEDATKITEVQVYRSNWLGAQGHEERKKLAEAAARVEAQAAVQRGQLP